MFISRNIQFNGILIFLYLAFWMFISMVSDKIANPYVLFISIMAGWFYAVISRIAVIRKCKMHFGIRHDEIVGYTNSSSQNREVHIKKTIKGISFDDALPSPWRLVKIWHQLNHIYRVFFISVIYFIANGLIVEYTKTWGEWGYDWVGVYLGTFIVTFGIFIGGLAGVLCWVRNPMVVVFSK